MWHWLCLCRIGTWHEYGQIKSQTQSCRILPVAECHTVKLWSSKTQRFFCNLVKKGSPYSTTVCRVPELIPVLGSQPAGDVSHKPDGRLPLLSARPAVTLATLEGCYQFRWLWTEAWWVWTVCLRLLPDSVAAAIWTQALLCLSPTR